MLASACVAPSFMHGRMWSACWLLAASRWSSLCLMWRLCPRPAPGHAAVGTTGTGGSGSSDHLTLVPHPAPTPGLSCPCPAATRTTGTRGSGSSTQAAAAATCRATSAPTRSSPATRWALLLLGLGRGYDGGLAPPARLEACRAGCTLWACRRAADGCSRRPSLQAASHTQWGCCMFFAHDAVALLHLPLPLHLPHPTCDPDKRAPLWPLHSAPPRPPQACENINKAPLKLS